MRQVFISYRRQDASGHAGRLQERLKAELGKKGIFVDVASVDPGTNFQDAIATAIGESKALIAVIGTDWISAKDENGRRRLDDPGDYVRVELEQAFRRNIKVIPALVRGAEMPRADQLPDSLRQLSQIQALELRDTRWDDDVDALLKTTTGPSWIRRLRRHKWKVLPFLLLPIIAPVVFFITQGPVDDTEQIQRLLARGNMSEAYGATARTFQAQTNEEAFVRAVGLLGLQDNASTWWSSRSINNNTATLSGEITTKQRKVIPVKVILVSEGDDWKVADIQGPGGYSLIEQAKSRR
jgi:hypothetical protein